MLITTSRHEYSPTGYLGLILVIVISVLFVHQTFGIEFIQGNANYWQSQVDDITQHLSGFNMYLLNEWQFPLLKFDNLNYPEGTNAIFVDAIPILALFLKIVLPNDIGFINPFGYWISLCFILQGISGWWIARELQIKSWTFLFFVSLTFLTFPALMLRIVHPSLMSHWIILFAFALYIRGYHLKSILAYAWTILLTLAFYIHIYLFIMAAGIYMSSILASKPDITIRNAFLIPLPAIVLGLSLFILVLPYTLASEYVTGGFGTFSMNLLSPFHGGSLITLISKVKGGQILEGFNYLGLGIIIAFFVTILLNDLKTKIFLKKHWPLFAILAGYVLYALSEKIYFGQRLIFRIWYPEFTDIFTSKFRSSGRFFWPVGYAIIIFSAYTLYHKLKTRYFIILLFTLLSIQLIDLRHHYKTLKNIYNRPYETKISFPALDENLSKDIKYIYFYPKYGCYDFPKMTNTLLPIMRYASTKDIKMNTGYIVGHKADCDNIENDIANSIQEQSAYLFVKAEFDDIDEYFLREYDSNDFFCSEIDFLYVCKLN